VRNVRSSGGTTNAFDQSGQGSALMLVTGALTTRSVAAPLAASLSPHFTVFAYDRRGRGDSGDTTPYAVEREVEDLDALITEAARLLPTRITKLAVYEPPFIIDDSHPLRDAFSRQIQVVIDKKWLCVSFRE
jgi:pimeloyl-ACP methyl ester carboxylesterase